MVAHQRVNAESVLEIVTAMKIACLDWSASNAAAQSTFRDALLEAREIFLVRTTVMIRKKYLPYCLQPLQFLPRPVHLMSRYLSYNGKESMVARQHHHVVFARVTVTKTMIV